MKPVPQKGDAPTPEAPKATKKKKPAPEPKKMDKELPTDVNPEDCVTLDGITVAIKPTRFKYFRNKMANIYTVLKVVPLTQFLSFDIGTFDDERDSDQILFDFLVSVFDDSSFVTAHYDNMTTEDLERILKIFGRINHIDEKEEQQRKNQEARATR